MKHITTEQLEHMEVINLCDGSKLGYPSAVELDIEKGDVTAIIIPKECRFFSSAKGEAYRIPWCRIQCIGEDAILVKLEGNELSACYCRRGRK